MRRKDGKKENETRKGDGLEKGELEQGGTWNKKGTKCIAAATQKNIRNAWEEKKSGENKRGIERMECEGASKADVYKT